MTPAERLLERLEGVRETGSGRWLARCPAHDDRSPSLGLREAEDGRLLVCCYAGCSAAEITAAVGLTLSDLFPPDLSRHRTAPLRRTDEAATVLRALALEVVVLLLVAQELRSGRALRGDDHQRLLIAAERVRAAAKLLRLI